MPVVIAFAVSILISSLHLLQYCHANEQYYTIHIDQSNSIKNCSVCSYRNYHNPTATPCRSYSHLTAGCITNSTLVVIHGTYHNLSSVLKLENLHNVTITGASSSSSNALVCCKTGTNAGFELKNINELHLYNVSIENCGALHRSSSVSKDLLALNLSAALYIENCTNVCLESINVLNNNGIGLVMYNTRGKVLVSKSKFTNNSVERGHGGGGMYIEMNSCPFVHRNKDGCLNTLFYSSHSQYLISECKFISNIASTQQHFFAYRGFRTFGQGGGLLISPQANATNNTFNITNCIFQKNKAMWGGGLHFFLTKPNKNQSNTFNVSNTLFDSNLSLEGGGGLTVYHYAKHQWVFIHISKCNFTRNTAKQGGGMLLYIVASDKKAKKSNMMFKDCLWKNNLAIHSSAVDLTGSEGYSGIVYISFFNTDIISNSVHPLLQTIHDSRGTPAVVKRHGNSAFMVTFGRVYFKGDVRFIGNNGTALLINSASATFHSNTTAIFVNNSGVRGGAISLLSSSYLWVKKNCAFNFTSNVATVRGGAIYSSTIGQHELHEHTGALGCFIQFTVSNNDNVSFIFSNNKADYRKINYGNSIFASSLISCASSCHGSHTHITASEALKCIANFAFINSTAENEVSSSGSNFSLTGILPLHVIPGKEFDLPIIVTDIFNNTVHSTLRTYIQSIDTNSTMSIDSAYTYISEKNMKLYGLPGEHGHLLLERVGYRTIVMSFNVTLDECPPGLMIGNPPYMKRVVSSCVCASTLNQSYIGIHKCRELQFRALILRGYWAGYKDDTTSENTLLTAHCPLNFCTYNSTAIRYHYALPGKANKVFLSEFICNENRTGFLCGSCKENYSVYFHSPNYKCGHNTHCSVGFLLYLVSELLPLSMLFSLVLILNLKFTSGKYNGFIFFAQIVDHIAIDSSDVSTLIHSNWIQTFNRISFSVYRIFNLNFFSFDSLSFCLWKGAKMLDIIIFKFVTISFAFFLVLIVYFLLNMCNFNRISICRVRRRPVSVVHGLSTFLIMCYAQCAQVSFRILTLRHLFGKGGHTFQSRVFYSGDTVYFSKNHVAFVIPALACIIVIVIIPTLLLLWYPNGQRLLAYSRFSETKCITLLQKVLPIHRMHPFFDSFQGCFKDKFRFFAGLYLAYRFSVLASEVFSLSRTQFYLVVEVVFIVISLLHSIAQPYAKRWHNVVDSLLFSILALVNTSSIFIYVLSTEVRLQRWIYAVSVFRSFLIALPLFGMTVFLTVKMLFGLKGYVKNMHSKSRASSELDEFPARLLDDFNSDACNLSYRRLKEDNNSLKAE